MSTPQKLTFPLRARLVANLNDSSKQAHYRIRGRALVGGTPHNACAATACQPLLELGLLHAPCLGAEMLATRMKQLRIFEAVSDLSTALAGDCVVCQDGNANGLSDHIWWIVEVLGAGVYRCLDNQGEALTHHRRLDGRDGKTPARGLLRLME